MDIWIGLGVGIVVVLIGFVLVPWLKDKGWFKSGFATEKQILQLANMVVKSSDFKNKDLYSQILTAGNHAVAYVEQVGKRDDKITNEEKFTLATEVAFDILDVAEVRLTDEVMDMVEIAVEIAVNSLPKTNK